MPHSRHLLTTFARELLNFVYPLRCAGCAVLMAADSLHRLCPACLGTLHPLSPPFCQVCGVPLAPGFALCLRCAKDPPGFGKARALFCYHPSSESQSDVLSSVIRRHKYGPNQALGAVLTDLLHEGLPVDPDYDVVVPVPLHPRRLLSRGFNQSGLLAAAVTRRLASRLDVTSLVRVIATSHQTAQDLERRRQNVHNVFAVRYPQRIAGLKVLLVDDVLTTGATANECAMVLRAAGAHTVDVLTIARAL
jgi:ComF family protein